MRKATPKGGPCAPLFFVGAVILIAANGSILAQTVDKSDLERCARLGTTDLKLECFEALSEIESSDAPSSAGANQEQSREYAASEKGSAAVAEDESAHETEKSRQAHLPKKQEDVVDELGREHIRNKKEVEEKNLAVRATVSEVVIGSYNVLIFHFANGQVWRQNEPRNFRYPRKGEFDVLIERGMMGDYRLRLDENSPMTRIKRVR